MEQIYFAVGKIVLRADNHHGFYFGRNLRLIEQVQFLKLNVLVLDKSFHYRDGTRRLLLLLQHCQRRRLCDRRLFVPGHVTDRVLFAFDQIDHRAGDRLLAFERSHARSLAERRAALIDLRHVRRLHRFIAALVIDHEQTFIADDFVFIE